MSPETESAAPPPVSNLLIKRLSEKARLPTRGSPLAAGYDLYSAEKKSFLRMEKPSGLASKFMIDTGAGVIDADYRGVVFVLLFNLSDKDFQVEEGDRIAQLIIERIYTPDVLEVDDLDATIRGAGGFGSTGGHTLLNEAPAAQ
ncbi:dUTPase-like protein [Flammula alnicola]|nr:dUTPase-like protein [Flammula alnicola]